MAAPSTMAEPTTVAATTTVGFREPQHLLCSITLVMFQDPVVVASGNTFERSAILEHWHRKGGPHDPRLNSPISSKTVFTNWEKRRDVQDFLEAHPNYVPDGWESRDVPAPDASSQQAEDFSFCCCGICLIALILILLAIRVYGSAGSSDDPVVDSLEHPELSMELALVQMKHNVTSASVLRTVARALSRLIGDASKLLAFLSLGGLELTIQTMRTTGSRVSGSSVVEFQQFGCELLARVSDNFSHHDNIMAHGGFEQVIMAMQRYPNVAAIQKRCFDVIVNLAKNPDIELKITSVDAMHLVLDRMKARSSMFGNSLTAELLLRADDAATASPGHFAFRLPGKLWLFAKACTTCAALVCCWCVLCAITEALCLEMLSVVEVAGPVPHLVLVTAEAALAALVLGIGGYKCWSYRHWVGGGLLADLCLPGLLASLPADWGAILSESTRKKVVHSIAVAIFARLLESHCL